MPRGPRIILGGAAAAKWPTPRGIAISVACGDGLTDVGLPEAVGIADAAGEVTGDAGPDGADAAPDVADTPA